MQNTENILKELLDQRIPAEYAEAAALQREILMEVFSRLDLVTLKPRNILDVGCATGDSTGMLKKRYPNADIIAIDSSPIMIDYAKNSRSDIEWICGSYTALPVADHSIDLLMANLTMPWCDELQVLLREWRRILRPDGLLILTSLGPDTLRELHDMPLAFPHLMDMHTIGDLLTQAGFKDPVLDVDYFTLAYREQKKCWHELQIMGMIAGNTDGVQIQKTEEQYALSVEVIFGLAWGADFNAGHVADEKGEVRIPVSHILRK